MKPSCEKRDPGLLEWTGGNIFKARVFPIEARSEKRIKIVYSQVLPLRANRYRYSYSLRSELLRTLLDQTDIAFHDGGRRTEGNIAEFANACLAVDDLKHAKLYFTEAVALHQKSNARSGLNDNTLSQYYQKLATVETTLGNTKEAVAAAMSSIVCWSTEQEN